MVFDCSILSLYYGWILTHQSLFSYNNSSIILKGQDDSQREIIRNEQENFLISFFYLFFPMGPSLNINRIKES